MKSLTLLLVILVWFSGCKNQDQLELISILNEERSIFCQLTMMKESIATDWDQMNMLLEQSLSPDMPVAEKTNILKVRNASLIRMFESFKEVDTAVQMALLSLEEKDRKMVEKIVELKAQLSDLSKRKNVLLKKMGENSMSELAIEETTPCLE